MSSRPTLPQAAGMGNSILIGGRTEDTKEGDRAKKTGTRKAPASDSSNLIASIELTMAQGASESKNSDMDAVKTAAQRESRTIERVYYKA